MTAKHQRFVEEYLLSLNAGKAAEAAGYTGKPHTLAQMGYELKARPEIAAAIKAGLAARSAAARRRRFQLLEDLRTVYERCMQAVEVLDAYGKPTGVWKFDSKGALGALQLEAKLRGLLKEAEQKHKHQGEIKLTIRDFTSKNDKP